MRHGLLRASASAVASSPRSSIRISRQPKALFVHMQKQCALYSTSPAVEDRIQTTPPPTNKHDSSSRKTHFGFETVSEAEKTQRVAGVFASVAESYDRMNDIMSFGWHRMWKDHFVSSLNPGFSPLSTLPTLTQQILDVAGGTGDIAFRLVRHAHTINRNPSVRVTISDINPAMLAVGARCATTLPASQQAALSYLEANAEDLTRVKRFRVESPNSAQSSSPSPSSPASTSTPPPEPTAVPSGEQSPTTLLVPSNSIDLYTVAFGIRNFTNISRALREAYRVLRPGGVFACLEFGKTSTRPLLDALYSRWSFGAIPLLGQLVAGDRDSYQYLVESIARFPAQPDFRDMIAEAGFEIVGSGWEDLSGGIAAIHRGLKKV